MEKMKDKLSKMRPTQILLNSFLIIIAIGTLLLMMPFSVNLGYKSSFLTSLFTATSAVSVTGLSVVDVSKTYSFVGQIVILVMIQLGGIGIMTFSSVILLIIGRRITYKEKKILQEDLNHESIGGIIHYIKRLFFIVIAIEFVGAIMLFIGFFKEFGFTKKNLYYSTFHSVSAFCNAGFSLFQNSLEGYSENFIIGFTIGTLITIGGIGFAVINSVIEYRKTKKLRFNLTSRMAVKVSVILIIVGSLMFFMIEYNNIETIGNYGVIKKMEASIFQSVTTRTAGFNTVPLSGLRPASIVMFIFMMFVGASPASTGGGIKTTTFGVVILSVVAIIRNKKDVEVGNRRISWHILNRALAIMVLSFIYVFTVTLLIELIEARDVGKVLFEVVSAFGTVGLTLGITSDLKAISKILLIITMLIGRVGPLTFAFALGENLKTQAYRYPRENIQVG